MLSASSYVGSTTSVDGADPVDDRERFRDGSERVGHARDDRRRPMRPE